MWSPVEGVPASPSGAFTKGPEGMLAESIVFACLWVYPAVSTIVSKSTV